MSSNSRDDELREASRTPAFRKVKRVAPEASPVTPAGKAPDPDLGHELIRKERYTSAEFLQLEWDRIFSKVWLLGGCPGDGQASRAALTAGASVATPGRAEAPGSPLGTCPTEGRTMSERRRGLVTGE